MAWTGTFAHNCGNGILIRVRCDADKLPWRARAQTIYLPCPGCGVRNYWKPLWRRAKPGETPHFRVRLKDGKVVLREG